MLFKGEADAHTEGEVSFSSWVLGQDQTPFLRETSWCVSMTQFKAEWVEDSKASNTRRAPGRLQTQMPSWRGTRERKKIENLLYPPRHPQELIQQTRQVVKWAG